MTDVKVINPNGITEINKNPTIVERLSAQQQYVVDDNINPGTKDWFKSNPAGVVFARNFRGFMKDQPGRKHDAAGLDVVRVDIPMIIPIEQIDELVKFLQQLKESAQNSFAKLPEPTV